MSLYAIDQRVKDLEDAYDALKTIVEMDTRLTSDGTEYFPVSLPDGTEYKMLVTTAFKKPFYTKTANYELVDIDKNSVIVMSGNSLTLTVPDDLGWNKGEACTVLVYGTGFTLANGGSVTVNSPQTFTDVENSVFLIHKSDTNEFSAIQLGQTSGSGDMEASVYDAAGKEEQVLTESDLLDEDDLVSDSDTKGATQQSIKAYVDASVASGVSDGDKGDVTVSSSGTVWTIDNDAVTYAKMQNIVANNVILGNNSGAGGAVDELTATEVRTLLNVEDGAEANDVDSVNGQTGAVVINEEDLNATVNYATTSGATVLDMSTATEFWRLMTGNSTYSFTNLPDNGEGFIRTVYIKGAYTINDFTALGWEEETGSEAYDGSVWNRFTIRFSKWGDGTSKIYFTNQLMPT